MIINRRKRCIIIIIKEYVCEPGKKSKVIINDIRIEIKRDPVLIIGFSSIGLLGTIITNTLIDQLEDIKEIGYVASDDLPPTAVFYDGILKHPFRLYYSLKHNIIIGTCEVNFNKSSTYNDLSRTICNWALSEDVRAKELVLFQGIPHNDIIDDFPIYYAADEVALEKLNKFSLKRLERGIVSGPEATLLNEAIANSLTTFALFTNVYSGVATPEGAASILDVLNQIYNLNVDLKNLIEEGKEIKNKLMDLAEQANQHYQQQQPKSLPPKGYGSYYQ